LKYDDCQFLIRFKDMFQSLQQFIEAFSLLCCSLELN